jgi:hypothetical protein
LHKLGWTSGYDVIKMATTVKCTQIRKTSIKMYLSIKVNKWDIEMTARNSLTHVSSTYTNDEDSSKNIRIKMPIYCRKKHFFTIRPMCTSNNILSFLITSGLCLMILSCLLYILNLKPTSFRYRMNLLRNPNLNMMRVWRHIKTLTHIWF